VFYREGFMQMSSAPVSDNRFRERNVEMFKMQSRTELNEVKADVYNQYLDFVRAFVRAFGIIDYNQADSVANDSYLKVLEAYDSARQGPGQLESFFLKVIRNKAIDSQRRKIFHSKGMVPLDISEPDEKRITLQQTLKSPELGPVATVQGHEIGDIVYSTVATMKDQALKRIGLAMLTEETVSTLAVSTASGLSLTGVKNRKGEVLNLLRSRLANAV
jgi:DNA-directed RNA polymerase specialized sigma24 family protein